MKRILAMLCVIACLFALAVPAMAAGTVTVHAYVPSDWTAPNCYTWLSTETNPNWPGDPMKSEGNGWWSFDIPANLDRVIINNGSGSPQTVDITVESGKEVWIKVLSNTNGEGKHEYEIGYSKDSISAPSTPNTPAAPSTGVDLAGLNSLALVGTGIPGVGEWNPGDPAGDMTKASNGVYTKVIAVTAGATMKFKVAGNDEWNDAYNFGGAEDGLSVTVGTKMDMINGGGSKDITLTATKDGNLKITVDLTGAAPTLLVEETDEEASTTPDAPSTDVPSGEMITVYAKVPDAWSDVRVWAWDDNKGDADPSGWPGTFVMTKGDNGWYSVQVPNWITGLLLNANNASVQTPDIEPVEPGKDIWINALTDATNPTYAYEEITVIPDPSETEPPTAPVRVTKPVDLGNGDQTGTAGGADNTVLFCIIGSVVVIAIAAVVFIILKKKQG